MALLAATRGEAKHPPKESEVTVWQQLAERQWTLLHDWLSRPLLRLLSHTLMRTSSAFSDSSGRLATRCGFARGTNDGVIDCASQLWLDAPGQRNLGTNAKWRSGMQRCTRSTPTSPRDSRAPSLGHSFSDADFSGPGFHPEDGPATCALPEPGKWHVLHVPDADHALGTTFSSHSPGMFETVLELLEKLSRHR